MDASCELPQLLEREGQLTCRVGENRVGASRIGGELALRQPEREGERHETLLCAVVQVALEAPPLGVAGFDEPHARAPQLGLVPHAIADVEAREEQPRLSPCIEDRSQRPLDDELAAVTAEPTVLVRARVAGEHDRVHRVAVALGDEHVSEHAAAHPFVVDDPGRPCDGVVEPAYPPLHVEGREERR